MGSQACPVLALPHAAHTPPRLPHAVALVPVTQVPAGPPLTSQQPPLQSVSAVQAVLHWCVCGSHDCPVAQSSAVSQPQASPPLPTTHVSGAVQAPHAAVPRLQADDWSPRTQNPPEQQPPLQSCVASHSTSHVPAAEHADPTGH